MDIFQFLKKWRVEFFIFICVSQMKMLSSFMQLTELTFPEAEAASNVIVYINTRGTTERGGV